VKAAGIEEPRWHRPEGVPRGHFVARILGAHPPRETAHEEEAPATGSGAACFRGPSGCRLAVHKIVASVRRMAGGEAKQITFIFEAVARCAMNEPRSETAPAVDLAGAASFYGACW